MEDGRNENLDIQNQEALLARVQELEEAVAAAAATAPPGGAPPVPPAFTIAPALANSAAAYLDLTSTNGAKQFNKATEALSTTPFDFNDSSDLQVFLDMVLTRSQEFGWNQILEIPMANVVGAGMTNHNILDKHGILTLETITTQVRTYYDDQTKAAQDSFMLCQCLRASLSIEFMKLITAEADDYHLPPITAMHGPMPCGPLLLKLIISKAHVDSRATVMFIRDSLRDLGSKMVDLDSNVQEFNLYVKAQTKALSARGETSNDLLNNLFKGYKAADDAEFQDFVRRKLNEYEEGGNVDVNNLMADAEAKFRTRCLTKEWSAPTKEQSQIIALSAQVQQLKQSSKAKKQPIASSADSKATPKRNKSEWAWKNIMPKPGEPVTKEFKDKHYHLACKHHPSKWVCHSTEECSLNPANEASASASTPTTANEDKKAAKRLKKAELAASLLEEAEESQGDDASVESR